MTLQKTTNSPGGILQALNQKLVNLNESLQAHDQEIKYLEELLTATSGPANDLVEDLERNQKRRLDILSEYAAVMKQYVELRDAN